MGYRLAAWPRAFKFIGDSHAARFDGLVFTDDAHERYLITQSHNHYGFRATEFSYPDGTLNDRLVRSLLTLNLVRGTHANEVHALGRYQTARPPLGWEFGLRLRQSYRDELLVIACGEIDARDIIQRLPIDARIATNEPIAIFPDDPPIDAEAIAEDDLAAEIEAEYLGPLFAGLRIMREIGIANVHLLALPPPGLSDADYEKHCGFDSRRHVRYAVHRTINRSFERFCSSAGIGFVDTWPLVTQPGGALDPAYNADSVHLNRAGAVAIVAALAERTADQPAPVLDPLV